MHVLVDKKGNVFYRSIMKYRQFGSKDFKVSALGLGCMRLPTLKFWPLRVNFKKAIQLIHRAIDLGINYFDTGWPYHLGQSEKVLGLALQNGYRERVHLVTKLPMFMVNKPDDFDRLFQSQLEKLKTDYIDTYLFHGLNESWFHKIEKFGLIKKMEDARDKGLIKNIGFSFHDTLPVFKQIVDYYPWDVVQIQYNYLDTTQQATSEGLKYAHQKKMAVIIMEPLKGGLLVNPPKEALDILNQSKKTKTPVEWALKYLWNHEEVTVVLSGMGSVKMLEENCKYADESGVDLLDEDDESILDAVVDIYKEQILVPCTACQYCMPCPFGVNIPENFALVNSANCEANNIQDRLFQWFDKRKYRKLVSDRSKVNKEKPNGNASLCTNCGQCVSKCPQSINIPEELKKCHQVLGEKKDITQVFFK